MAAWTHSTANDHILAEGLIDDDTLAQFGETTFTILNGKAGTTLSAIPRLHVDATMAP
ncbi:hypothetical protein AHiyo4_23600 [Arthrobacter sp. Hiyo4]|nr:hypothetical protein AHiyo4_23600 [Arthrobacter sp. Hiyo4]